MKETLKKFISFLLFFSVFTVLINSCYLFLIAKTDWTFSKRIESMRFNNPDFELLVFGTSLADYGIDTELLTHRGIKSFNLALVGNSIKTCYIQFSEYLSSYNRKPKYVLLSVNSSLEVFDKDGIQPVVEFTMKGKKIDIKDFPLSKFQWQTSELIKKALSSEYRSGYTSFGQTKRKKIEQDNSTYNSNLKIDIDKFESAYWMGKIAELCKLNEIRFIIVEIPGVKEVQNISEIGPYTLTFRNGHNGTLYNCNTQDFCSFLESNKDWAGLSHLNENGAAKLTTKIIEVCHLD